MSRVTDEQINEWRKLLDRCDCGQCHVCTLRQSLDALEYERHWSDKFERRCHEAEAQWLEDRKMRVATEAKLAAVRELHKPVVRSWAPRPRCAECSDGDGGLEDWPCDTVRLLDAPE